MEVLAPGVSERFQNVGTGTLMTGSAGSALDMYLGGNTQEGSGGGSVDGLLYETESSLLLMIGGLLEAYLDCCQTDF